MRLLEEHHQRLSELLKIPEERTKSAPPISEDAVPATNTSSGKGSDGQNAVATNTTKNDTILREHPRRTKPSNASIYVPRRMPNREMSSSIASNLASARGIRSGQERRALSPSVTTRQVPGNVEVPARKSAHVSNAGIPAPIAGKPSWLPPVTEPSKAAAQVSPSKAERDAVPTPSPAEEGFQRWTSTFGNLISKISPALAFTGLPLTTDTATLAESKETSSRSHQPTANTSPTRDPDLTKIFSKSALSTLRHQNPGGDSFYVVPTAGHTVSYANILRLADKEKRRLALSVHSLGQREPSFEDGDNDDFVDARESFGPTSPSLSRTVSKSKGKGSKDLENMVEELYTENKSLKDCIDQLTKRLHSFEMAAQSSGLAMQESIRLQRPPSPVVQRQGLNAKADTSGVKEMEAQVRKLGEQVDESQEEIQRLGRENEKLRSVVNRYRERWEKLKEGAKTRRSDGGPPTPKPTSDAQGDQGRYVAG